MGPGSSLLLAVTGSGMNADGFLLTSPGQSWKTWPINTPTITGIITPFNYIYGDSSLSYDDDRRFKTPEWRESQRKYFT